MEKKIKLTELTKEELRSVSGGFTAGAKCADKCGCEGNTSSFGDEDSNSRGGIKKPISPITRPK